MVQRNPQREKNLTAIAEQVLRHSGMDSVGLYQFDEAMRPKAGVILGMPQAFCDAYEISGMRIDPILHRMKETGLPSSTVTQLGARWERCELYKRVSGKFGLKGFAAMPLYREDSLVGILYLGTNCPDKNRRLDLEGLFTLSPHTARVSTRLMTLPEHDCSLTPRQNDIARLAADGLSNRSIAEALGTGEAAVRKHLKALNRHFSTTNRTAMAAAWRRSAGSPFGD
ncbi:MAG: helix-turn-helix transcriptional regulator [Pseudomonadota bacterium]